MKPLQTCLVALLLTCAPNLSAQDPKKPDDKAKKALQEIAGSAEFLRAVPKKYATLGAVDTEKREIVILAEGEKEPTRWPLTADAEIKVRGWWGRLEDLRDSIPDQPRVWAWFKVDRAKKPVAIFMLADDLSEQDIHGDGLTVKSIDDKAIVFAMGKDKTRAVDRAECSLTRGAAAKLAVDLKVNDRVFVHRTMARQGFRTELLDGPAFQRHRTGQKQIMRQRWLKDGLPGAIGFLHVYAGEVDVILDHEAMRWGRSLAVGTKVELAAKPAINAVVKSVAAQREKTQVRLVVKSFDLADLTMGQRVQLKMPAPAAEIENAVVPPGIDGPKTKEERIEWFLANIYCTCKVGGDGCTGHFYTLASCNPNSCGAPNQTRKYIAKKIEEGWTNREIFDAILKERGPTMLRPHLLP